MSDQEKTPAPLPIWFFVGIILLVYGVLLVVAGFLPTTRQTILQELHPSLWWGALTALCGGIFLGIGIKTHRNNEKGL